MLAKTGPNGERNDSFVAMFGDLQKSCFGMLGGFWLPLWKLSIQISMVLSKVIFVNKESTPRLTTCKLGSC